MERERKLLLSLGKKLQRQGSVTPSILRQDLAGEFIRVADRAKTFQL